MLITLDRPVDEEMFSKTSRLRQRIKYSYINIFVCMYNGKERKWQLRAPRAVFFKKNFPNERFHMHGDLLLNSSGNLNSKDAIIIICNLSRIKRNLCENFVLFFFFINIFIQHNTYYLFFCEIILLRYTKQNKYIARVYLRVTILLCIQPIIDWKLQKKKINKSYYVGVIFVL